jgi:Ca2+-binding RTX toxin-like protein
MIRTLQGDQLIVKDFFALDATQAGGIKAGAGAIESLSLYGNQKMSLNDIMNQVRGTTASGAVPTKANITIIDDVYGKDDVLDLRDFNLAEAKFTQEGQFDLKISMQFQNQDFLIKNYFSPNYTNPSQPAAGGGLIERLEFKGEVVDFNDTLKLIKNDYSGMTTGAVIGATNVSSNILNGTAQNDYLVGNWGNDVLSGGDGNDTLLGGIGNDTYRLMKGFDRDVIFDNGGTADRIDLSQYKLSEVSDWQAVDTARDTDGNLDSLLLDFKDGSSLMVFDFFNNVSASAGMNAAGAGFIENISFSDDQNVTLAEINTFIAS